MRELLTFCCLALLVGCSCSGPEPAPDKQESSVISETEARQLASDHANLFLKDKTYKDINGTEHAFPYPFTLPSTWHGVTQTTNGWLLFCEPPAGPFARVEMDLYGKNVKVTHYGCSHE